MVLTKCVPPSAIKQDGVRRADLLFFICWAINCAEALEVTLGTGVFKCNPKDVPVILPLFYPLPPPLHLLQLMLQHALCSEAMPDPLYGLWIVLFAQHLHCIPTGGWQNTDRQYSWALLVQSKHRKFHSPSIPLLQGPSSFLRRLLLHQFKSNQYSWCDSMFTD